MVMTREIFCFRQIRIRIWNSLRLHSTRELLRKWMFTTTMKIECFRTNRLTLRPQWLKREREKLKSNLKSVHHIKILTLALVEVICRKRWTTLSHWFLKLNVIHRSQLKVTSSYLQKWNHNYKVIITQWLAFITWICLLHQINLKKRSQMYLKYQKIRLKIR